MGRVLPEKRKTVGNELVSNGLAWCKMVGVVELESTTSTMSKCMNTLFVNVLQRFSGIFPGFLLSYSLKGMFVFCCGKVRVVTASACASLGT